VTGAFAALVLAALAFWYVLWAVLALAGVAFGVLLLTLLALGVGWVEVDNTEEDE